MKNKTMTDSLMQLIEYHKSDDGQIKRKTAVSSSINLPSVDLEKTAYNLKSFLNEMEQEYGKDELIKMIKKAIISIKDNYIYSHDGFRKTTARSDFASITIPEIYSFSIAVAILFEHLHEGQEKDLEKLVGIGVIAPAGQDCGKNLIKLAWSSAGYEVLDFGCKAKPKDIVQFVCDNNIKALGISCMLKQCIKKLNELLALMKEAEMEIPIIIGGIAVNNILSAELSAQYGLPVYYSQDVRDAESVLLKALTRSVDINNDEHMDRIESKHIIKQVQSNMKIYELSIDDVAINEESRSGCHSCSGDKKTLCPLEIGYEEQLSLEDSLNHLRKYDFAMLVQVDLPDGNNRYKHKKIWLDLIDVEQQLRDLYGETFAFRLPIACPFCRPKDCSLHKGHCTVNSYYRPLHETYNINIPLTIEKAFRGNIEPGLYSLIMIQTQKSAQEDK